MYIRNKQQMAIFSAAFLMVVVFVFLVFVPLWKKAAQIGSQRELIELMISNANEQGGKVHELKEQLETLQSELAHQQSYVPDVVQLGQFLQTISALMNQYQLQEQFVKPQPDRKIGEFWAVPIDIRCKGQLSQMYDFFESLQSLQRLIRIENVSLLNSQGLDGQLTMETKAVIFYKAAKEKS